eukprot:UN28437
MVIDKDSPSVPQVTYPKTPNNNGIIYVIIMKYSIKWEYSINGTDWIEGSGNSFLLPKGTYPPNSIQLRETDSSGNLGPMEKFHLKL